MNVVIVNVNRLLLYIITNVFKLNKMNIYIYMMIIIII